MTQPATVIWFKRDLRIADHPALAMAAEAGGPVIPLYIVDPVDWCHPDAAERQWDFVAESLGELRAALAALGAPLLVRRGGAVDVLEGIRQDHPIGHLVSHLDTGLLGSWQRDRQVAAWARAHGIRWSQPRQSGVIRHLKTRNGWAAKRERFVREAQAATPARLCGPTLAPGAIPSAAAVGLASDDCPLRQRGGRAEGEALLHGFLHQRGEHYRSDMASPVTGEAGCSRLSPHLAWGTLSVREVAQATAARAAEVKGQAPGWSKSMASFKSRLAWRDHFTQKLEDFPLLDARCMHGGFEGMRVRSSDDKDLEDKLQAFAQGRTGLPFVDACLRYASATGWLNFRARAMVQAVASYHLWLDWRDSGPVLARLWTDYAPGIHWAQSQMQSGVTGINTVRIYNPIKQGHDQDPTGTFTREWVPELAGVAPEYLQEPWKAPTPPRGYPAPLVDPAEAAREARDRIFAHRARPGFREAADAVANAHGSRKSGMPRTAHKRARARKTDPRQSELGL